MKKIIIGMIALLLFAAPAFAATKIAYVDLQKALRLSKAGIQAKSNFDSLATELETELKIKEGEFLKLKSELEKQFAMLSDEAKQEKTIEAKKNLDDLQKFKVGAQRKLQAEDSKWTQEIVNDLTEILKKFGKDGGYSMIVERSEGGLIYIGDDVTDLTDKLIKKYDANKK